MPGVAQVWVYPEDRQAIIDLRMIAEEDEWLENQNGLTIQAMDLDLVDYIQANSVDKFQGQQTKIVILSLVRSNAYEVQIMSKVIIKTGILQSSL